MRPSSLDINIIPGRDEKEGERGRTQSLCIRSASRTILDAAMRSYVHLCACYARPVWPLMFAIPAECANTTIATFRFNASTAHPLECYYLAPRYLPEDFSAAYLQRQQPLVRFKYPKFVLCFSEFKRFFLIRFSWFKTSSTIHISDYNRYEILLILDFNLRSRDHS